MSHNYRAAIIYNISTNVAAQAWEYQTLLVKNTKLASACTQHSALRSINHLYQFVKIHFVTYLAQTNSHNFISDGAIQNLLMPSCSSCDGDLNGIQQITCMCTKWLTCTRIMTPGNIKHFCRFSGGGDILISKKTEKTESMVISNLHDSHSSQQQDDDSLYPSQLSPKEDTDCISGFTVEGKNGSNEQ